MKPYLLTALLLLQSCAPLKLTPAQAGLDAGKVTLAAILGFAAGGPTGAILGAASAEVENIRRIEKTLGKNPRKVTK